MKYIAQAWNTILLFYSLWRKMQTNQEFVSTVLNSNLRRQYINPGPSLVIAHWNCLRDIRQLKRFLWGFQKNYISKKILHKNFQNPNEGPG